MDKGVEMFHFECVCAQERDCGLKIVTVPWSTPNQGLKTCFRFGTKHRQSLDTHKFGTAFVIIRMAALWTKPSFKSVNSSSIANCHCVSVQFLSGEISTHTNNRLRKGDGIAVTDDEYQSVLLFLEGSKPNIKNPMRHDAKKEADRMKVVEKLQYELTRRVEKRVTRRARTPAGMKVFGGLSVGTMVYFIFF